jgi:succinate dehydrogenase / fumarate reductase flavoprotein subunit
LNILLKGFLKPGDHVLTTSMEHNAVMRPLRQLEKQGVEVGLIPCREDGTLCLEAVEALFKPNTRMLVMTHGSNVCGTVMPVKQVAEICKKYAGIDVTKESIPVYPSVHFFMGGLDVDGDHQTSIGNLYAIGECASRYHGANRLGGNSLLAAIYGGRVAAKAIGELPKNDTLPDFSSYISEQKATVSKVLASNSRFSAVYVRNEISKLMKDCLGITRTEEKLTEGISGIDYYLSISDKLTFDPDVSPYVGYSIKPMLLLARAILTSALERRETRGAHIRNDYPERSAEYERCSVCTYRNGEHHVSFEKEDE